MNCSVAYDHFSLLKASCGHKSTQVANGRKKESLPVDTSRGQM